MSKLKPETSYIYERADGVTYVREFGEINRTMIRRDSEAQQKLDIHNEIKLWGEITRAARTNSSLQEAIDRVKLIYHLSKENGK